MLFDGKNLDNWTTRAGGTPTWKILSGGVLEVGKDDIFTKQKFDGNYKVHVEFLVPLQPSKKSNVDRGNSGVYVHGRYEVQILDSYKMPNSNRACGAIYGILMPVKECVQTS